VIHVYKQTKQPVSAFEVMRVGGRNNIAGDVAEKFLVLWDVHAIKRGDTWHYIFDFDQRDTLQMSELAQLMNGGGQDMQYQNAVDWAKWLREGWKIVGEQERWQILHPGTGSEKGEAKISDIRVGGSRRPMPE
jgi:hypothetical protein